MKEVLGSTKATSLILTSLAKHLKTDLPALRGELRKEVKSELLKVVVYGINKGTATRSGNNLFFCWLLVKKIIELL